jgi:hypothetical protein
VSSSNESQSFPYDAARILHPPHLLQVILRLHASHHTLASRRSSKPHTIPIHHHIPTAPPIIKPQPTIIPHKSPASKHNNPESAASSHRLRPRLENVFKVVAFRYVHVSHSDVDFDPGSLVRRPCGFFNQASLPRATRGVEIEADLVKGACGYGVGVGEKAA